MDKLYMDLNGSTKKGKEESVHLSDFPMALEEYIDKDLEERMELAQKFSSMILSLRKKSNIRVRQPLQKIIIPVLDKRFQKQLEAVENLILSEVNVKEVDYLTDASGILVKKIKPNFKALGPRYGKMMKQIAGAIGQFTQDDIAKLEQEGVCKLEIDNNSIEIQLSDVEILTEDIPGWLISNVGNLTVALDATITPELEQEGLARDLVNRIQNIRKDNRYEVTDKIRIQIERNEKLDVAIQHNFSYICSETLAENLDLVDQIEGDNRLSIDLSDEISVHMTIDKI
jgi:isoleucyl-tRNA synthetase